MEIAVQIVLIPQSLSKVMKPYREYIDLYALVMGPQRNRSNDN